MNKLTQLAALAALLLVATMSEAKTFRAVELGSQEWTQFLAGKEDEWVVEFRQGDEIPMTVSAEGDFFETRAVTPTPLIIKKNFWLKINMQKGVFASLDGSTFKPLPQVASGVLSAGASTDSPNGVASGIQMSLKAFQK